MPRFRGCRGFLEVMIPLVKIFDSLGPGGRQRVEEKFATVETVGQSAKQLTHFAFGEIHEKAFGDDQGRSAGGYRLQPSGIGHRRADHPVCIGFVVELAPELDDAGLIEVGDSTVGGGLILERPGIQTAAEV